MNNFVLAAIFGTLTLLNGLGSLVAVLPLFGMMTNANGFLSGEGDTLFLLAILSLPICFVVSGVLFNFLGQRLSGLLVGAIPSAIWLWFYTNGLPF